MNLYLRKVVHPQAHDNYRAILKLDEGEFEIGSIGIQHGVVWAWGIDTVIPVLSFETEGEGRDRKDRIRPDFITGTTPEGSRLCSMVTQLRRHAAGHHFSSQGRSTTSNAHVDRCWRCNCR